jgi:hypothetical protein
VTSARLRRSSTRADADLTTAGIKSNIVLFPSQSGMETRFNQSCLRRIGDRREGGMKPCRPIFFLYPFLPCPKRGMNVF